MGISMNPVRDADFSSDQRLREALKSRHESAVAGRWRLDRTLK
jgi:hypothetical protein